MPPTDQVWENIMRHAVSAGVDAKTDPVAPLPFSEAVWRRERGENVDLRASFNDLLRALQRANIYLNGPIPSESVKRQSQVPLGVSYAVSNMITQCLECEIRRKTSCDSIPLINLIWVLAASWDLLLAGDIDDLASDIQLAALARGIDI